jgi:hypothetical protein
MNKGDAILCLKNTLIIYQQQNDLFKYLQNKG